MSAAGVVVEFDSKTLDCQWVTPSQGFVKDHYIKRVVCKVAELMEKFQRKISAFQRKRRGLVDFTKCDHILRCEGPNSHAASPFYGSFTGYGEEK